MPLCGIIVRGDWALSELGFGPVADSSLALMGPLAWEPFTFPSCALSEVSRYFQIATVVQIMDLVYD